MIKCIYLSQLILLPLSITSFSNSGSFANSDRIDNIDSKDKVIYVDISLNDKYKEEGSSPYLTYNDGTDHNINLIYINNDIYQTETSISYDVLSSSSITFNINCFSGTYKSVDINSYIFIDAYNYVCLDSYVDGSDIEIEGYGCYGYQKENPGATYLTQRVWLNNENTKFYENDAWGKSCQNAVGYYFDNKWNIIPMVKVDNTYDNKSYYYADIPYTLKSITLLKISQSDNHNYLIYESIPVESLSYGVCYFVNIDKYGIFTSPVNGASAYILGCVVEAYLTYGKDDSNGSTKNTVSNLFNTWFKNKSASKDDLKKAMIDDYSSYKNNSYADSVKDGRYSVNEKWNTLCSQAGIDPNTGKTRGLNLFGWLSSDTAKIALIIGSITLVSVGGAVAFIIIKKKKQISN